MTRKVKGVSAAGRRIAEVTAQLEQARADREEALEKAASKIGERLAGLVREEARRALLDDDDRIEDYRPPRGAEARAARDMIAALLSEHGTSASDGEGEVTQTVPEANSKTSDPRDGAEPSSDVASDDGAARLPGL